MTVTRTDAGPAPQGGSDTSPTARPTLRWRWVAACLGLVAVAFVQDPGRIAADTKLDLTVDPVGLLERALSLWEPLGFFGQLTNQGYGYLFPMGPFYALGGLAGIPDWVVQRLWWSLLLVVAFLGIVRLTRLLGIAGFAPRLLAGLAFALGPRMVTELGVLSVEVLPYAVAPWVLIPLVAVASGGSYRRAAALSGLAVVVAGGVNAVASAAVLPLAAWWILTRFTGRARWVLAGWWSLAVVLATLWWSIPLMLLGRYSSPFLDWIESASVTTSITAPDTVLRGTSQWVAYIADGGGPVWPSGWSLVTQPVLIVATGLVAAIGVAGLALTSGWGPRWRAFLVGGLLLGWVAVGIGHIGAWPGAGSDLARSLLDGALAPLRNTHKFEVLIRLPVAVGVSFAAQWLLAHRRLLARGLRRSAATAGIALVVVAMGISAWPALTGELTRDRSFASVPDYWGEASTWLAEQDVAGRALVLPGASFGVYGWGRTNDEPLQALGEASWAVRDAVPLASAGAIRWLDAVSERVTTGRGSPGLADALARAGIEYVVIRNDLDRRRSSAARPEAVRQALVRSGGFTAVAGFGPVFPPFRTPSTVVDGGLIDANTAVEIWRVDAQAGGTDPRIALRPMSEVLVVGGGSEALVDLADAGVLGSGTAVVLDGDADQFLSAVDPAVPGAIPVRRGVTDTYARSEVIFGRSWDNRTGILTEDEPYSADRAVHDYVQFPGASDQRAFQAVAVFDGGFVSASSSGSDADAVRAWGAQSDPFSAIDGDPATAWQSGDADSATGQWWQVTWASPVEVSTPVLRVRLVGAPTDDPDDAPAVVAVVTDQGIRLTSIDTDDRARDDGWRELAIAPGPTRSIRLTLEQTRGSIAGTGQGIGFGIREVDLPVPVQRPVAVPGAVDGGPAVFTAARGERAGCLSVGGIIQCDSRLPRPGAERAGIDRLFTTAEPEDLRVFVRVRPRPGPELDALLLPLAADAVIAEASSSWVDDPAARPQAATDGSLETAWIAGSDDPQPVLRLNWSRPRTVEGVRLSVDPRLSAALPLTVTVIVNGVETTSVVDDAGRVLVPAQEATGVSVRFDNTVGLRSIDPITGSIAPLPIGISEITVLGPRDLVKGPLPGQLVSVPCGFGPTVSVDGRVITRTAVTMTVGDVLTDASATATPCDTRSLRLEAGTHRLAVPASPAFTVESVTLEPTSGFGRIESAENVTVITWDAAQRVVDIPASDQARLIEFTENANAGWVADAAGQRLTPVRVDGWRQAWVVPPGTSGPITMTYAPNGTYRTGLLIGLLGILAVLAIAVLPARRRHPQAEAPSARAGRAVLAGLAVVAATIITGWPGLLVALLGLGLGFGLSAGPRWGRRVRQARAGIVAVALGSAAVVAGTIPWPQRASAPDWWLAVLAALTVLGLAAAAAPSWTGRPTVDGSAAVSDAR